MSRLDSLTEAQTIKWQRKTHTKYTSYSTTKSEMFNSINSLRMQLKIRSCNPFPTGCECEYSQDTRGRKAEFKNKSTIDGNHSVRGIEKYTVTQIQDMMQHKLLIMAVYTTSNKNSKSFHRVLM